MHDLISIPKKPNDKQYRPLMATKASNKSQQQQMKEMQKVADILQRRTYLPEDVG